MILGRENLVPARMNALWFTYVALFLFALLPDWGFELGFFQIIGVSSVLTVLLNVWNWHRDKPIFDERKQEVITEAMAWAFVVVSLALIPAGTIEIGLDQEIIRDTAELGLWAWLLAFSLKNLYHKYGESS